MGKFIHPLSIERTEYDEDDIDEAGQPTAQTPTTTSAMGLVQPRSASELADYRSAGSEIGAYVIFLPIGTDVSHGDAVFHGELRFNVQDVRRFDYGGLAHLEVDAELVGTKAPIETVTVPSPPTNVVGVEGDGQVTVTWAAPSDDGGSHITGYRVVASPGGATVSTTGTLSAVVDGLTNGTAYTFSVSATNRKGTGSASSPSGSKTPKRAPGAPTLVSATPSGGQVVLLWSAPASNGGRAITSYRIYRGTTAGAETSLATVGNVLTYTDTNVSNGTTYYYKVSAITSAGEGAKSNERSATPTAVPGAPTLTSLTPGDTALAATWAAPVNDGGSAITGYTATASPGGASCTGTTGCSITGLTNGTAYSVAVVATNATGDGPASNALSATPRTVPGAPTGVSAVAGDGQATVSWAAPASNGGAAITSYTVIASPGGATGTASGTSRVMTGLANGTAYTFTVKATNAAGTGSASSASASVTPASGAPVTAIQPLLDAAVSGATIHIPAGTYRETLTFSKPVTLIGAGIGLSIIDGRNSGGTLVRSTWAYVNANDVTIQGFTMQHAAGVYATGSVENAVGVQRFTLEDCELAYSYVNLNLTGAIDSTIRNCVIHDAIHLGVRISAPSPTLHRGQNNSLIGCTIYHNDRVGEPDPGADGGNVKATGQDGLVMDGNDISDSGKGLWLDVSCADAIYRNNRIYDHDGPGIHDETSTGSEITGNVIYANGFSETWGWGAGVLVAACKNTEVHHNTLAWNQVGISFISQNRSDDPGMTGNYSHDNFVAEAQMAAGQDHFGEFWAYDYIGSVLYLPESNNHGLNDVFYYALPDGSPAAENSYARFIWDGYHQRADFALTPGGTGATYASQPTAAAILTAAGLPLTP